MPGDLKGRMSQRSQRDAEPIDDIDSLISFAADVEHGSAIRTAPASTEERLLPIEAIWPDPIQPRRAMPDTLRAEWLRGTPVDQLLLKWETEARADLLAHQVSADWHQVIEVSDDREPLRGGAARPVTLKAATRQFLALVDLAASIYVAGLEQPVTVYQPYSDSRVYRLLVGERRLLAFWLLIYLGYRGYERIPALERDGYSALAQAAENGARQNLNAIAMARQLAILLLEVHHADVTPIQVVGQAFYAQAADLDIPRGMAPTLAAILGLPSVRMLQHYKSLLRLPELVFQWADEYDWPEGKLRGWMRKAPSDDLLIALAKAEYEKEIGQADKPSPPDVAQRTARKVERAVDSLRAVADLDVETFNALPDSQRKELRRLAFQIVRRFGRGE